jgi:very-short-patch-repair endonuclease
MVVAPSTATTEAQRVARLLGDRVCIHGTPDEPLFQATHVGALLGIRNVRESMKRFMTSEKVFVRASTKGGYRQVSCLTLEGLKRLVSRSTTVNATRLALEIGMDIYHQKTAMIEAQTLERIMAAFQGLRMITQYTVLKYRIDLYFPDYKLAVECDELHHRYNADADRAREADIQQHLQGCSFIRYEPLQPNFDVLKVINEIVLHIVEWQQTPADAPPSITDALSTLSLAG